MVVMLVDLLVCFTVMGWFLIEIDCDPTSLVLPLGRGGGGDMLPFSVGEVKSTWGWLILQQLSAFRREPPTASDGCL